MIFPSSSLPTIDIKRVFFKPSLSSASAMFRPTPPQLCLLRPVCVLPSFWKCIAFFRIIRTLHKFCRRLIDFSCGKISIWQRGRKKNAKIKTIKILLRENFYSFSKEENVLKKKHIVERTNLHFSRKPWGYKGVYFVYFGYIYFSVCKNSIKREVFAPGYSWERERERERECA